MTYAVFGQPIAHSLSPRLHRAFAAQRQQVMDYQTLLLPPERCPQGILDFFAAGGQGANVTLPHKACVYAWLEEMGWEITPRAQRAKAVNTLYKTAHGLGGDNTDGQGFLQHLAEYLHWPLTGKVLLLGAGGACRGLLAAFAQDKTLTLDKIYLVNRTLATAQALALEFADALPIIPLPWENFAEDFQTHIQSDGQKSTPPGQLNAIIHTTSLGHDAAFALNVPKNLLTAETWGYDLSYGQAAQSFLTWARAHGVTQVSDGLGMLVYQAAAAFARWQGWHPDAAAVLETLLQERASAEPLGKNLAGNL